MFDIGFWELAIIAIVGLIVIGPDKLPGVARTAGKWVGRTRRFVNRVKMDINREIQQDELRKLLEKEAGLDEIKQAMNAEMDTNQYNFEEESFEGENYLVGAIDDAQAEHGSIAEEHADIQADINDDSSTGHPDRKA